MSWQENYTVLMCCVVLLDSKMTLGSAIKTDCELITTAALLLCNDRCVEIIMTTFVLLRRKIVNYYE